MYDEKLQVLLHAPPDFKKWYQKIDIPQKIQNHFPSKQTDTPPKTNISTENQWLEDEISVWKGPLLGDEKPTGGHKQDAKKLAMIPWAQGPKKSKSHQIGIQVGWKTDTSHDPMIDFWVETIVT